MTTNPTSLFAKTVSNENNIPSRFLCALSGELMQSPVRIRGAAFFAVYEETALNAYFEDKGYIDPQNQRDIKEEDIVADRALQRQIQEFLQKNPEINTTTTDTKIKLR